ncbi:MAG: 4-hydroxy-tetrahydrodipicolinate reductase [Muribaculaceae bacterium]
MNIVISGYGKMGHMIESILIEKGISYIASEDITAIDPEVAKQSVCIDFTTPDAFRNNYAFIASHFKAAVIGTTGWADIKQQVIDCFNSHNTTMIYASNFSLGVNVMFAVIDKASALLADAGYDPYIVEMHHCHKLDAPSGTAKSLGNIVDANMNTLTQIQSVRCGEIAGIHTVGFEGANDRITITHEAFSRMGFAQGAVKAALLTENITGVKEFKDIII